MDLTGQFLSAWSQGRHEEVGGSNDRGRVWWEWADGRSITGPLKLLPQSLQSYPVVSTPSFKSLAHLALTPFPASCFLSLPETLADLSE
jgi:hypothetical protein